MRLLLLGGNGPALTEVMAGRVSFMFYPIVGIAEQVAAKKIKVLAGKAIGLYERTLEAAERTGTSGPFIEQARSRLERMKQVMLVTAQQEEEEARDRAAAGLGPANADVAEPAPSKNGSKPDGKGGKALKPGTQAPKSTPKAGSASLAKPPPAS